MFVDTHAHLYLEQFDEDIDQVIERSLDAKVNKILFPNIDAGTLPSLLNLADAYPEHCYPMIGLHPCSVNADWPTELAKLKESMQSTSIVAIGEIGIDLYWDKQYKEEQILAFNAQIELAMDLELPIVIHSRAAIELTIASVEKYQNGSLRGVFHCFDQSLIHAQKIIDLGFHVGIGGILTYKKNEDLRQTFKKIPVERILLETDAPYLPPVPFRGKRNESSYLPYTAQTLANICESTISEIANITTQNAIQLFKLTT